MKHMLCVVLLALLSFATGYSQKAPYRVVFDLTSRDTLDHKVAMRWVSEVIKADPNAMVEVVMYGKGFELVMPEKSRFIAQVQEVLKNPNVSFKACEVALHANNVKREQILSEVGTVPDGIYEIISKQHEGWGYIKVVH